MQRISIQSLLAETASDKSEEIQATESVGSGENKAEDLEKNKLEPILKTFKAFQSDKKKTSADFTSLQKRTLEDPNLLSPSKIHKTNSDLSIIQNLKDAFLGIPSKNQFAVWKQHRNAVIQQWGEMTIEQRINLVKVVLNSNEERNLMWDDFFEMLLQHPNNDNLKSVLEECKKDFLPHCKRKKDFLDNVIKDIKPSVPTNSKKDNQSQLLTRMPLMNQPQNLFPTLNSTVMRQTQQSHPTNSRKNSRS